MEAQKRSGRSSAIGSPLLTNLTMIRSVASARAALGEATFVAAWAEGQAMTLDQAIEYALTEAGV